jgi:hypothetical protein
MPAKKTTSNSKTTRKKTTPVSDAQVALNEIRTHERECALRYERIEERLAEGSNKFQKLERMIWGVYILIVGSILIPQFLGV